MRYLLYAAGIVLALPLVVANILLLERIFGVPGLPFIPTNPVGAVLTGIGVAVFVGMVIWELGSNRYW